MSPHHRTPTGAGARADDAVSIAAAAWHRAATIDPTMPSPMPLALQDWAGHLLGVHRDEALTAVEEHYRRSGRRVTPGDITTIVEQMRNAERHRARADTAHATRLAAPAPDDEARARHRAIARTHLAGLMPGRYPTVDRHDDPRARHCPWCGAQPGQGCTRLHRGQRVPCPTHPSRHADERPAGPSADRARELLRERAGLPAGRATGESRADP